VNPASFHGHHQIAWSKKLSLRERTGDKTGIEENEEREADANPRSRPGHGVFSFV
jgi:hypothetical protein